MLLAKDGELDLRLDCDVSQAEKNIANITALFDKLEKKVIAFSKLGVDAHPLSVDSAEKEFATYERSAKQFYGNIKSIAKSIEGVMNATKSGPMGDLEGGKTLFDNKYAIEGYIEKLLELTEVIKEARMQEDALFRQGESAFVKDFRVSRESLGDMKAQSTDEAFERYREDLSEHPEIVSDAEVQNTEENAIKIEDATQNMADSVEQAKDEVKNSEPVTANDVVEEGTAEKIEYTADNILQELSKAFDKENVVDEEGIFNQEAFDHTVENIKQNIDEMVRALSTLQEEGASALAGTVSSFKGTIEATDKASKDANELEKQIRSVNKAYENQARKIEELNAKEKSQKNILRGLETDKISPMGGMTKMGAIEKTRSNISKIVEERKQAEAELEKLKKKRDELSPKRDEAEANADAKKNAEVVKYANIGDAIQNYIEKLKEKKEAEKESEASKKEDAKANRLEGTAAVVESLSKALRTLASVALRAGSALVRLQIAIGKGVVNAVKAGIGGIKQLIARLKHTGEEATRSFKRLLRYTLGLRGMFTLFRRIRTAVKQAIRNLVQFDDAFGEGVTSVNNSISMLKNSFTQLKNQVIAAFAPLINIVIPQYIVPMINAIIAAMQKLAMFIAYLTGAPKWIRATKINDNYAKSLDNVGGSAKKAANNLSSLDEIHLWQDDNGGGGGGGGDTTKPEDMFEWVDTPEEMMRDPAEIARAIAERINAAIDQIPWQSIGEKLADKMNKVLIFINTLLDNIEWGKLGSGLSTTVNAILQSGKWEELGEFLVQKKNVLTSLLNGFFDNLSWQDLSDAITRTISSAISHIDIHGIARLIGNVVTGALSVVGDVASETNWDELGAKIVDGLETLTSSMEKFDWDSLGQKIAEGINKIPWGRLISSTIDAGGSILGGVLDAIISAVETLDTKKLTKAVSEGVTKFFKSLTSILQKADWDEIGKSIAKFIGSMDFSAMLDAFFEFEEEFVKAIAKTGKGLFDGIKIVIPKIWLEIKDIGAQFGIDGNTIWTVLIGALGAIMATAGGKLFIFNPTAGIITVGLGIMMLATSIALGAEKNAGASFGEQLATIIAGAIGALGVLLAVPTGGWSLILTAVALLTITTISINAKEQAEKELSSGIKDFKEKTQKMIDDALSTIDLIEDINLKITGKVESVDVDFTIVKEQLEGLLSINTSDGVTVQELNNINTALDTMKKYLGDENYNELGLYFDTATGSIMSAKGEIHSCRDELNLLIDKMLQTAKVEAMHDVLVENYRDIIKAQQEVNRIDDEAAKHRNMIQNFEMIKVGAKNVSEQLHNGKITEEEAMRTMYEYEQYLKSCGLSLSSYSNAQEGFIQILQSNNNVVDQAIADETEKLATLDEAWTVANTSLVQYTEDGKVYEQNVREWTAVAKEGTDASTESVVLANDAWKNYGEAVDESGKQVMVMLDAQGRLIDSENKLVDSCVMIKDATGDVIEVNDKLIENYKNKEPDAFKNAILSHKDYTDSENNIVRWNDKVRTSDGQVITVLEYMARTTSDKAQLMQDAIALWAQDNNKNVDEVSQKYGELPTVLSDKLAQMEADAQRNGLTMEQLMGDNGVNIVKGLFMGMEGEWDEEELNSMWDSIGETLCSLLGINSPSTVMSEYGGYIMQGLLEGMKTEFNPITEFFNSVAEAAKKAFADIPANIASGLSGMGGRIKAPLNDAITVMNSFISKMISVANKFASTFNSIRTGINSLPNTTKLPYLMQVSGFSVSALAAGAVIPPNAPFLAMLGDQSRGRNLEAPESLIREIMREELGTASKGGSYQFVAQLNRRTLFEEMIDEAEMRQLRTGENPFML